MSQPLPEVHPDASDGDWIKRGTWDIRPQSLPDLYEWLFDQRLTPDEFKQTELYRSHVDDPDKLWLLDL